MMRSLWWLVLICVAGTTSSFARSQSFDPPLQKVTVDAGPSSYELGSGSYRRKLTCSYYRDFVVKEFTNEMVKGGTKSTLVPMQDGGMTVPCRAAAERAERDLHVDGWFLMGVRGPLVFVEASEGDEAHGMAFHAIQWKTGRVAFEDSALGAMSFGRGPDGTVLLRYMRVVMAPCSIPQDGAACWRSIRRQFGVVATPMPRCQGYLAPGQKQGMDRDGIPLEERKWPSAIGYPVAVRMEGKPVVRATSGVVTCMAPN